MLGQRVITALVLLALLLPAMWADDPIWFRALTAVFMGAAAWEWARLSAAGSRSSLLYGAALGVPCLAWSVAGQLPALGLVAWVAAAVAWAVTCAVMLRVGIPAWSQRKALSRLGVGLPVLGFAWLALVSLHGVGVNLLLSVLCIVWAADIGGYFAGRQWGRHKLAPSISPGKTWEGVVGGVVFVLLVSFLWQGVEHGQGWASPSIHFLVRERYGLEGLLSALAALTALSISGDLIESLIKRAAGVKDSSSLLPGHGGVLDRIDALLPVLPAAMALMALSQRAQSG